MALYRDRILPRLIAALMQSRNLHPYRARLAAAADGCTLEIGIGAGPNLPFYPERVTSLFGLEPQSKLLGMAARGHTSAPARVTMIQGMAEMLPFASRSLDTVVLAWTLCSIGDDQAALAEIRRVLRPGGKLLFVEHGLAPEIGVRRWQHRLSPYWQRLAGGCHLDRPVRDGIEAAGFKLERLETGYLGRPTPFTFMYEGIARPR